MQASTGRRGIAQVHNTIRKERTREKEVEGQTARGEPKKKHARDMGQAKRGEETRGREAGGRQRDSGEGADESR